MLTTLELTIRRTLDGSHIADAELTSPASAAATQLASNAPVAFDETALLAIEDDPLAYGTLLSHQLFADPRLRDAWLKARAYAATGDLQLRLNLDAGDAALHELCWETLRDPEIDQPIALYERVRLVRALDSSDLTPVVIPPRPELRALLIVSNPSNLGDFKLAEVDVEGEVSRARAALGAIPTIILADHVEARGRATLANIAAALRNAPPIVILVAHGTVKDNQPYVWLEQDDGTADRVTSDTIAETLRRLSVRPLLLVLASCRSAGGGYGDTLRALGPRLAGVGVPAVLAFQGDVTMSTVKTLLPMLIAELRRDGQIDRALASARAALGERRPWWQAVLWLRTEGRLWREEAASTAPAGGISIGGNVGTMHVVTVTGGNVGSIIGSQHTYGAPAPQAAAAAASERAEAVNRQRQRLAQYRETLSHYLDQLAISGLAHARPEVTAGIREARAGIARAKAALVALGEVAEDLPDDGDVADDPAGGARMGA